MRFKSKASSIFQPIYLHFCSTCLYAFDRSLHLGRDVVIFPKHKQVQDVLYVNTFFLKMKFCPKVQASTLITFTHANSHTKFSSNDFQRVSVMSASSSYQHGIQKEKLHQSITRIQCLVRKHQSRNQLKHLYNQHVDEIYDSQYGCYFYYNKKSQTSSWNKLKILSEESLNSSSPQKKRKEQRKDKEKKMLQHNELNVVELNNVETVNSHSQILVRM